ncbi:MAG: hypothetical protein RL335_1151 [Bacteroidota bacterium]|jgi:MerC mercury resistance protein
MFKINYDALGIATSIACAIHCAVLPLLLSSLPLFGINIINNSRFEIGMVVLAFVIGIFSLRNGYKHHHRVIPILMFSLGILLLLLKQFFHAYLLSFLIPAVVLIVGAHWMNYRSTQKYADACPVDGCTTHSKH